MGVRLEDSVKGGSVVCHNSESSLVVRLKSNQQLDPLLIDLQETVLIKSNESFTQGEDSVIRQQGRLCVPDVDGMSDLIM